LIKHKNKNIRHLHKVINEFKKGYQPRTNLVRDEKGDLLADPHKNVNRWMNYFGQLLNVSGWGVLGRQKYRQQSHLCQSVASLEVEDAIGKLKRYKSPGADQIAAELISSGGGGTLHFEIHKLIKLICQLHTKLYPTFFSLGYFLMHMKLLRITNVYFDVIGQRLIRFSIPVRY
jgi:hypothetical protein